MLLNVIKLTCRADRNKHYLFACLIFISFSLVFNRFVICNHECLYLLLKPYKNQRLDNKYNKPKRNCYLKQHITSRSEENQCFHAKLSAIWFENVFKIVLAHKTYYGFVRSQKLFFKMIQNHFWFFQFLRNPVKLRV